MAEESLCAQSPDIHVPKDVVHGKALVGGNRRQGRVLGALFLVKLGKCRVAHIPLGIVAHHQLLKKARLYQGRHVLREASVLKIDRSLQEKT